MDLLMVHTHNLADITGLPEVAKTVLSGRSKSFIKIKILYYYYYHESKNRLDLKSLDDVQYIVLRNNA